MYRTKMTLFTLICFILMLTPLSSAHAQVNVQFQLHNENRPYLIAGTDIYYELTDDKAASTIANHSISYSTDNLNWEIPVNFDPKAKKFQLPLDPAITSVKIHLYALYVPILGSDTIINNDYGPFKVMQPGYVTDLTPVANADGSITLSWMDNSNMESAYVIKREGPDGTKYFNVQHTESEFGPVTTTDSTTSKTKNTFYAYSVTPLIDQYDLPDSAKPGVQTTFIINKAPWDGIEINDKINPIIDLPTNIKPVIKSPTTVLKPIDGLKIPKLFPPINGSPNGDASSSDAMLEDAVGGASDWAKADLKLAITESLTTSAVLGNFQQPITREHFAGIAVKLYEALSGTAATAVSPNPFSDTTSLDVLKAYKLGIVSGVTATTFAPKATITRQELCVMLMRAVKAAKPSAVLQTNTKASFADSTLVASWAQDAVNLPSIMPL